MIPSQPNLSRSLLLPGQTIKRRFHYRHALFHHLAHRPGRLIRQQVGNPDESGLAVRACEHLSRPIVVRKLSAER